MGPDPAIRVGNAWHSFSYVLAKKEQHHRASPKSTATADHTHPPEAHLRTYADLAIRNAVIHTMDPNVPAASALAVTEGQIMRIGSADDIGALIGPDTEVRDLAGAAIVPGLIDAHNHHSIAGRAALFECQFPDTATADEIVAAVAVWVAAHPDDEWAVGGSWGSDLLDALSRPEALSALDAVSGGAKVLLTDYSLHNKWANTAAMTAAGITADSPDPEGGRIVRGKDGALTGVLLEVAGAQVVKARTGRSEMDPEFWAACSRHAIATLNARGITAFMDASASKGLMAGLAALDSRGELSAWAVSAMLVNDFIFGTEVLGDDLFGQREDFRTAHHRPDFAKIFLDGVPPSYTAAFLEPYAPTEQHGECFHGTTTMPPKELVGWLRNAGSQGIGVKVHCTGDASVRFVLDAVETVRAEGIMVPFHVAHGQYIAERDIPRFGQLDVIAEISPALWFPGLIVDVLRSVLSEPTASHVHPNRSLLDTGATVACGSDWPVSPDPNPWTAISGLVTRADPYGQVPGTVWAAQAITVQDALTAYTMGGASALGLADSIGSLTPGKSADFVVLDRDPLAIDPAKLAGTVTLQTWFEGALVYSV